MRKIADARQMASIDRRAQEDFGMPSLLLMENAGLKAVRALTDRRGDKALPDGPYVFLAGRGNNGGDALVMARQYFLQGKTDVCVVLASGSPAPESPPGVNLGMVRALGIRVLDFQAQPNDGRAALARARVIFDGLAGTGLQGAAAEPLAGLIALVNSLAASRVAVDVPSGLSDSYQSGFPAVRADLTLCFGLPKRCLYLPLARPCAGEILTIDLGFPPTLIADPALPLDLLEPEDLRLLLPAVPPEAHKTTRGHLGVFAGAPGTSGAAVLASQAAARGRTGLVTLYTDPDVYPLLGSRLVSVMCQPLPPEGFNQELLLKKHRAFLIGPGFGLGREKTALFKKLFALPGPKVIDADGLTLLASLAPGDLPKPAHPLILTPHPGECARLLGRTVPAVLDAPYESALEVSRRFQAVCVLKTHVTFISDPEGRQALLDGMNPALGTAGSGDVLAGLIAGFLAQGIDGFSCARGGVLLHARAGRQAFRERGWFLAEDLLDFISPTLAAVAAS